MTNPSSSRVSVSGTAASACLQTQRCAGPLVPADRERQQGRKVRSAVDYWGRGVPREIPSLPVHSDLWNLYPARQPVPQVADLEGVKKKN